MRASAAWRTGSSSLSVLISAANAASRYLFSYSSNGFVEIQWYLFGASVFLGASYTLRLNEHVRVDVVYSHLSPRGRLYVDIFGLIVFLLPATIFLGWLSWPVFVKSYAHRRDVGKLWRPHSLADHARPAGRLRPPHPPGRLRADQADCRASRRRRPRHEIRTAASNRTRRRAGKESRVHVPIRRHPAADVRRADRGLPDRLSRRLLAGRPRPRLRRGRHRHRAFRGGLPAGAALIASSASSPTSCCSPSPSSPSWARSSSAAASPRICSKAPASSSARSRAASPMRSSWSARFSARSPARWRHR